MGKRAKVARDDESKGKRLARMAVGGLQRLTKGNATRDDASALLARGGTQNGERDRESEQETLLCAQTVKGLSADTTRRRPQVNQLHVRGQSRARGTRCPSPLHLSLARRADEARARIDCVQLQHNQGITRALLQVQGSNALSTLLLANNLHRNGNLLAGVPLDSNSRWPAAQRLHALLLVAVDPVDLKVRALHAVLLGQTDVDV